ncbi:lysosomal-trafficking regulator isoform X3 [Diprion similis]|uniref:lysosomal-trafficking regulator isoform X3 n=1 Tax=Diprion similis TaxID=362088 RepID=UPI001EF79F65|nr:lysosomal-trafficking regulator isoform X3 [Diprion similis]
MTTGLPNRLQLLWDYFIHAEPQSYEKSEWLDIFLAELLVQVKDGRDVKDALSFCSGGGGGVSTLVACELLSDVHMLCAVRTDGGELKGLRKYLVRGRGWRCLAVLHLLGVRGLSCGRELVALLVALYPVAFQESEGSVPKNPYIKFHCNNDIVDTVNIIPNKKQKHVKTKNISESHTQRKKIRKHSMGAKTLSQQKTETKASVENVSSESEMLTDGIDQARSLTLKIRLNPMDFEYFTSVVRSDEEEKWDTPLYQLPSRPIKRTPECFMDERIEAIFNTFISPFETSLLIIQLLQGLRDYDTPAEQTPAVQVLKFALDTLWALQFGIDGANLTGTECASLKAAAARLMLTALERVLRADEPTTAVIHNGLLPMTLRLLEDACSKPVSVLLPEEGSLLQEFIFATTYGIITFLYCLLHQRGTTEKLKGFLELFQLFTESQDGKIVERTILTIVGLPSVDQQRSVTRARKVIDMVGALISALKRVRMELCHMGQCRKNKHRSCADNVENHHHFDILGIAYTERIVGSISKQSCCISALFMTLTSLLKESHLFSGDLQVRLLKVAAAAGTCCCCPPKAIFSSIVTFLKKRNSLTYAPAVALLERTLFKELGAYPGLDTCNTCSKPTNYSWDFLELYTELLIPDDPKMCYVIMAHLLKVTPNSNFLVRQEFLFKVFYPTFQMALEWYEADNNNAMSKFLIQSCLSVTASLIVNAPMCERFTEINGLDTVLEILLDPVFTRNVCALLEVSVIMEIWKISCEDPADVDDSARPALVSLLDALDKETRNLLDILENYTAPNDIMEHKSDVVVGANDANPLSSNNEKANEVEESIIRMSHESHETDVRKLGSVNNSQVYCATRKTETNIETDDDDTSNLIKTDLVSRVIGKVRVHDCTYVKNSLSQASAVWRAAAGVALCSPTFRTELSNHPVSQLCIELFRKLAVCIASDEIKETGKSLHRLMEALMTCCLTSPLTGCDLIKELRRALIDTGIKLGHGIAMLVEALLRVAMLKPSPEQTMPQQIRPRLPTMTLDPLPDIGGDDSSTGEYVTADDGYEADIEVPGRTPQNSTPKKANPLGPVVEARGYATAHPALCSLAVDLLIHFSEQGMEGERGVILTGGLRRVAITCRESVSSCAALAASGAITRILDGFKESLTSRTSQCQVVAGSASPPTPTSIIHLMSIGYESLVLETWLDLRSDKLIFRLTRPDDKTNRTISETSITGTFPSGRWHHLALNCKDTVLNKRSAVVEVVLWIDGWREARAQLPFDGLLVRKPGTTCILLGQLGPNGNGAWYLGNLMLFRCPVFTRERALYLASLGPNYTSLAECTLNTVKPDFAPLIASGALNGVREFKFEGAKFDTSRRKSYGGTYLRHVVETKISDTEIDWDAVMDATNSHLGELQDNLLLSYEAQTPNILHLYPQAVASSGAVVGNLFPGQPGFRIISAPEHRVSQQPPLSVAPILMTHLECQQYRGLIPAASLVGGIPVFLYLFARVVELNSTEEEQALALSTVLHLARSDSELLNQYRSEDGPSLLLRVLESPRCHAGRHILKAMLDAACDSSILIKDIASGNHAISQNCEAVITDPELINGALSAWRAWAKYDTLNFLLQALLVLLRDQHSQREFNATQLNRVDIVDTLLTLCKEHFMYEDLGASLDTAVGTAVVELVQALMGAPPEFPHLVAITDYLVLVHQASETYVTHAKHNIYFLLPPLEEKITPIRVSCTVSSSDESINTVDAGKLNKALANIQIQKGRPSRKREHKNGPQREPSAGEDSGIAASDGSATQIPGKQSVWTDERRACQGMVCEGLLLLLRDALRMLPDSQVGSVVKHVLKPELLLVLANNPDARVRTALLKLIQTYLERASDEEVNKFIKQKYFMHLANQISLYPGSESLVMALESLALCGPATAGMPPLLAMILKASATDPNIARPMVSFVTDMVTKNPNALRALLEMGLAESIARALISAAHRGSSTSLLHDFHVLLVAIATKLLESPGTHHMQAVADLHLILSHVELRERSECGIGTICVSVARDAQVALFDGELDTLTARVSSHHGFRLRSTASYLASMLTTSSEQSDHGSRSSSYGSLQGTSNTVVREAGKGELSERLRAILIRAVEFITTADQSPSATESELTRRLFATLLHGLASPKERKNPWGGTWSSRPVLRKNTAKIMVWLLGPHQSNNMRVYAVRCLMEEPKLKEILTSLLEVHPQIEQKFTVFLWDLLQRRDEMPTADARVCAELREALSIWNLTKSIDQATPGLWNEELIMLRRELMRDRDMWMENNLSAIHRIGNKFDLLAKQLMEGAMAVTRAVVKEQNFERKILINELKQSRAMKAQAMARWRDLAKRLTHERAPWHFPENYPRSWELDPTEGPARIRIRMQRCHLKMNKRFLMPEYQEKLANMEEPLAYLLTTDRQDANSSALIERLHTTERIRKTAQARVVTPGAELRGEALIGESCLYFVPENPDMPLHTDIALDGLDLAMAGGTAWRLEDIRELHRRRYQLQERAIEIFIVTGRTYLLAFNSSKERDEFVAELSACNLPRRIPGDDLGEALALWRSGVLTNWEYITRLNKLAGRSYNDLMQYPVFPFVLSDYFSEKIDLEDPKIYRNFKRPMAVQDKKNEQYYINNYNYLKQALMEGLNLIALNQEPFHYGSHYSNSGTVLHFLVRLPPFTSMFLSYQDNNFDIPDRTFHALATTWRLTSCDSTTDVKELIPEFFYLPEFLLNSEGFNFGVRQNGYTVSDVELPPWCGGDARLFILAHRAALEAELVREVLPFWIDLVFGFRQTGRPAVEAINVFHPATYYGFNVEQIADPLERQAWETMVRTYGQTPAQLFRAAHPLAIQNLGTSSPSGSIPIVIEGVAGIKWGNYVGAPGNEPVLCWKHKHRSPLVSLVPLSTGDVFGLPNLTALLLGYSKEKGASMLSGASVLGAALASWGGTDGIARLKSKKEQPPRPLLRSSGLDPITILASVPDCGQLWAGHLSGRISVYSYSVGTVGKIQFSLSPASSLLAHRCAVTAIALSRAFSIAVSSDNEGVVAIWDLNRSDIFYLLSYVRSVQSDHCYPVSLLSISETLGDIAIVFNVLTVNKDDVTSNTSELRVYTINTRLVGTIASKRRMTALCYSNAPEGVSVNVIATGLDDGVIRLWSSWDLRLVREIVNGGTGCGAIIALAWALDQHHLYAAAEDSTVLIWEGIRRLSNGTPKFVNLSSL